MQTASATFSSSNSQYGITLLRVSLGAMWIAHALLKLFVFTLAGTAAYFTSVGLPGFMAYPVFALEIAGGVALILGIYTRYTIYFLLPIMLVATWVHFPNGWVHTSPNGGWEYPAFLSIASIAQWFLGDGAYALKPSGLSRKGN